MTGWTRTFPLTPRTDFSGNRIEATVSNVDLKSFMTALQVYEAVTGHAPRYYTASFVVDLEVRGTVAGESFTDHFQPRLVMRVILPSEAFPETEETRAFEVPSSVSTTFSTDPFHWHKPGEVTYQSAGRRPVTMLGVSADVYTLRWLSLLTLGAALTPIGGVMWLMQRAGQRGEAFAIRARYGPSLVQVDPADEGHTQTTMIKVSAMDDLVRLSHHTGGPLLVESRDGRRRYMVREGEHFYAYEGKPEGPHASPTDDRP